MEISCFAPINLQRIHAEICGDRRGLLREQKSERRKKKGKMGLFFVFFFGVVFAFVDAQLALGFNAAAFAGVFASDEGCQLEERAF
jgi:hypothetical protein